MGKHDDKKKGFDCIDDIEDLKEAQKAISKKIEKAKIPCSHSNDNGKIKIRFLDEGTTRVQCKRCGEIFDFRTVDGETLRNAVTVVHNAINQIKALSDNPREEKKLINTLGEMDYNLKNLIEIYDATTKSFNKGNGKKKKKNHDYDSFGQFGAGSVRYIK